MVNQEKNQNRKIQFKDSLKNTSAHKKASIKASKISPNLVY